MSRAASRSSGRSSSALTTTRTCSAFIAPAASASRTRCHRDSNAVARRTWAAVTFLRDRVAFAAQTPVEVQPVSEPTWTSSAWAKTASLREVTFDSRTASAWMVSRVVAASNANNGRSANAVTEADNARTPQGTGCPVVVSSVVAMDQSKHSPPTTLVCFHRSEAVLHTQDRHIRSNIQ
ncbi:exported hypothetical protein [Nocardioides sp. AX2bis]|nr:exported hypothetical protein [Nocardioides sp. AX2bis]